MSALARLIEQAPMTGPRIFTLEQQRDMARLLIDMAAFVRGDTPDDECEVPGCNDPWCCDHDAEALLARFAELEQRAAP